MADNDVRIKLTLDGADQVQSGLAGVGDGASEANSKLGGLVGKGLKGAGKALVGFAGAAVAAGGALSAGVISAYADYEQNVGGIETLFGESADRMMKYASDAYKTAGLSANEYMEQATSFAASLTGSLGDGEDAAKAANDIMVAMSDNANKMGTDIGSIQNAYQGFAKQNYTMLDNLKLGYGGTQAEMQRLLDDAEKLPAAMGQEFDISNFADVSKAIQLIQEDMGIAGTTAKEATETISGSVGMLKGAWSNLLVGLGDADSDIGALAENVVESLQYVLQNVGPVIENIGANIGKLGPQLGDIAGTLVESISGALPGILEAGVALVGGLVEGVSSALPSLITAIVPAITGLVEMVATQAPLLLDAGLQAVTALATGIAEALPTLIPIMIEGILGLVQAIIDNLPMMLDAALQLIQGLAEGLIAAMPILIEQLPILIQGLVNFFIGAVPQIIQVGLQLLTSIVGALPEIIAQIVAVLPQIITSVITAILGAIPQLIQAGIQLLTSLVSALPEIITTIVAALPEIITSVLDAVIGSIPQIIDAGIELFIALIGALPQIINTIVGAIPQIIGGVVNGVIGAIPQLIQAGVQLLTSLVTNLPQIIGKVVGAIPQIIGGIVGAIGNGAGQIVQAGYNLISGMWEGISNAGSWLYDKVMGWAGGLLDGVKSFFGIHSPSRVFRDEIGKMLPAGLGEGVDEGTPVAEKSVKDMNKAIFKEASDIPPLTVTQDVVQQATALATPTFAPMAATPTAIAPAGGQNIAISGPLVSVASMQVRNDQDIRRLSTQLRTDMNRELRAQGVLV
ncbi:tail length tape measure protein [Microbacterium phage Pikmin]|uniref:Tape measure protein n=1 Tax=Microbacterium phage Pikmin TaxID=2099444 RepID=A0A2P1CJ10_9CAUD|nr:tail length tape measure protein [Microbacterium phage Pikmin]AVJ51154.1 tape measure protein [Microbacterium phage Pikmin]